MKRHKILAFLLALIVSVALWVYAVTIVNPNDTVSISDVAVRITGTASLKADGLILTGVDLQYVDVEIAGRRSDLKELNSSTVEVIADVGNIDGPGSYELSWTISPPSSVASGDIRLVSSSANRVIVRVSELRDREIPVELRYNKEDLPAGFDIGEVDYTDFVSVSGPADEVGRIMKAVVAIDLNQHTSKINEPMSYVFEDENGEQLVLSEYTTVYEQTVGVMMQIQPYKDITLELMLRNGGGLNTNDVTYTLTPSSIRVTGVQETLDALPDTLVGSEEISLADIEGLEPEAFKHQFDLPDGVTRWGDGNAATVTVDVQIEINPNIAILKIPLSKTELVVKNGAQDMEYFYADADAVIELRGDAEVLKTLELELDRRRERIVVTIDIDQMDQTQMCVLDIALPQDFAVGLFKEYSARIEVKPIVVETTPEDPNVTGETNPASEV